MSKQEFYEHVVGVCEEHFCWESFWTNIASSHFDGHDNLIGTTKSDC